MTKPVIVTRAGKGSALTWTEGDSNLTNLRDATITVSDGTTSTAIDLNGTITFTAGSGISIDEASGTVTITNTASAGISNVSEDTSPTLGGDLDVGDYSIVSTTSRDISIVPDNTGKIYLGTNAFPTTGGTNGQYLQTNGSGTLSWASVSAELVNDSTPQLGGSLDVQTYSIVSTSSRDINITPDGTGSVILGQLAFPNSDGTSNQVLKTDGAGTLSWTTVSGIGNVVEDATPQLGGELDGQGNVISNVTLKRYKETVYDLGSTDSPSIDLANGNIQNVTISSGLTIPTTISNFSAGSTVTLIVSGSGTASGSGCIFAGGNTTLTTSSIVSIFYDGSEKWVSIATDFQ